MSRFLFARTRSSYIAKHTPDTRRRSWSPLSPRVRCQIWQIPSCLERRDFRNESLCFYLLQKFFPIKKLIRLNLLFFAELSLVAASFPWALLAISWDLCVCSQLENGQIHVALRRFFASFTSTSSKPVYSSTSSRRGSRHCSGVVVPQVFKISLRLDTNMLLSLRIR